MGWAVGYDAIFQFLFTPVLFFAGDAGGFRRGGGVSGASGAGAGLCGHTGADRGVACGPAREATEESSLFNRRYLGDMESPETGVMDTQRETTNVRNVKRAAQLPARS